MSYPTDTMHFDSMQAMARFVRDTEKMPGSNNTSTDRATEWHRFFTMQQSMDLVLAKNCVWREGIDRIQASYLRIPKPKNCELIPVKNISRSVAGSRPRVPAAITGSPKSMITKKYNDSHRPVLKMAVSLAASHTVDSQAFFNRGAAILSIVKGFESKGIDVELIGYMSLFSTKTIEPVCMEVEVILKKAHVPIALRHIAFPFCHAAMLRRFFFAIIERSKIAWDLSNKYYGYPVEKINALECYDLYLHSINTSTTWLGPIPALNYITKIFDKQRERKNFIDSEIFS